LQNKTLNEYLEQLRIYVQQSNYNDSIDLLNRAISQYPEENKLRLNLGNIYKLLERNDDAVKIFKDVLVPIENKFYMLLPSPQITIGLLLISIGIVVTFDIKIDLFKNKK